jgi:hypothetical protein
MGGQKGDLTISNAFEADESDGIIPRAIHDIFELKQEYEDNQHTVQVQLSCLEIYQDELRDLLANTTATTKSMKLRDQGNGITVRGLRIETVHTRDQVRALLKDARVRRKTASTRLNDQSSRSHAIFTISVAVAPPSQGKKMDSIVTAKLTLVDLAGSERIKNTGVVGVQQQESININKDLFVLGKVVSALSERSKRGRTAVAHVPYRDSKLTRLLRDSLGGNCRTVLIACVSPTDMHVEESINTLPYAERSRTIANVVKQNLIKAEISPSEHAALRAENKRLRAMVAQLKKKLVGPGSKTNRRLCLSDDEEQAETKGPQESQKDSQDASNPLKPQQIFEPEKTDSRAQNMHNSFVSPLLSYELSMGIADDDNVSLIDDSDSLWSLEDSSRRSSSTLQAELETLKGEKLDLETRLHALQSRALPVTSPSIGDGESPNLALVSQIEELRLQLLTCQTENDGLKQHNHHLQTEISLLHEVNKRLSLKYEIDQIRHEIEKRQSPKREPLSPAVNRVLKESSDENYQRVSSGGDVVESPARVKRVLIVSQEEEKKSDDHILEENNYSLQTPVRAASSYRGERDYRNDSGDEYTASSSKAHRLSGVLETKATTAETREAHDQTPDHMKEKVEEILDMTGRIFDVNSTGSVTASAVSSVGTFFAPCARSEVVISNIDVAGRCNCEDSMFGGRADHVDFYLPKLGVACNCGRGNPASSIEGDPLSLSNILRPWQCDFLASLNLFGAEEYARSFKDRGHAIAKDMRRWRKANGLLSVRTKSCIIALHIWSRTCRSVIKSVRDQRARGVAKPERPDFLQISITHDAGSVSTMGFG